MKFDGFVAEDGDLVVNSAAMPRIGSQLRSFLGGQLSDVGVEKPGRRFVQQHSALSLKIGI